MQAAGVDTAPLKITPGVETSGTLVVNVKGQDRRFIHTFGAAAHFDGSELSAEQILQTRVLYVGGYFAMPKLTPAAIVEWFRIARSGGVKTVLDVVIPGPGDYATPLKTILPYTDYFLPNSDEAELMTGLDSPVEQARLFREWGADTVIITCGEHGAVALSPTASCRSGVFPVNYVDGTGSGDAFDAGIICGLLEGADLKRSISLGTTLGASAVQQPVPPPESSPAPNATPTSNNTNSTSTPSNHPRLPPIARLEVHLSISAVPNAPFSAVST